LDRLLREIKKFEGTIVNEWNLKNRLEWLEKGHFATKESFDTIKKWR
jgi:hypothetical protein